MKGKVLFTAISAMLLAASCSNDEVTELNMNNAIKFNVTTGNMSRATVTKTDNIDNFKVWAYTSSDASKLEYMKGVTVTKSSGEWTYSPVVFWPKDNKLDFYAVSPSSVNPTINTTTAVITDYTVADGSEDLLYSYKKEATKGAAVNLNFRHALSQIAFKIKNTRATDMQVKVKSIKVKGIADKATLTWAAQTTGDNLSSTNNNTETGDSWGTWSTPAKSTTDYGTEYTFYNAADDNESTLTTSDAEIGEPLFLMPQTLDPWNKLGTGSTSTNYGACLLVDCQIMGGTDKNVKIWPEDDTNYATVAIPLTNPTDGSNNKWMQGKKYVYTIIFGEGAGYKPTPGGDNPEPVLVPITFTVTVDEFQDGGTTEIDAKN